MGTERLSTSGNGQVKSLKNLEEDDLSFHAVAPVFDFLNSAFKEDSNARWGNNGTRILSGNKLS